MRGDESDASPRTGALLYADTVAYFDAHPPTITRAPRLAALAAKKFRFPHLNDGHAPWLAVGQGRNLFDRRRQLSRRRCVKADSLRVYS